VGLGAGEGPPGLTPGDGEEGPAEGGAPGQGGSEASRSWGPEDTSKKTSVVGIWECSSTAAAHSTSSCVLATELWSGNWAAHRGHAAAGHGPPGLQYNTLQTLNATEPTVQYLSAGPACHRCHRCCAHRCKPHSPARRIHSRCSVASQWQPGRASWSRMGGALHSARVSWIWQVSFDVPRPHRSRL
jgi:hypothetical protein